jgi:putative DNA methylase
MLLPAGSVDLVLTDPPYHDDVQYSELSLPLRGWAQLHMDRLDAEALVNQAVEHNHGEDDYRDLLRRIFAEAARTMRPDGHLIFSYANREPEAWIAVLGALQDAGLRASGYCLLHSENETDVAKRGVRACTLDLLMDLVPASGPLIEVWEPREFPETAEGQFLRLVGRTFARIGDLSPGWESEFARQLRASEFLGGTSRPESVAGSA